jgi:hypothetical protein
MDLKLVEYVRTKKNAGLSSDEIKYNLLSVGWGEKEVIQALAQEADIPLPSSIPSPTTAATPSTATNFWDVFEHILLFISLYVVATSLALLLHYFVNQNFPATTYDDYGSYRSSYSDSWESALVTGYASALIVSFPIFYFLFRRITVRTLKYPDFFINTDPRRVSRGGGRRNASVCKPSHRRSKRRQGHHRPRVFGAHACTPRWHDGT